MNPTELFSRQQISLSRDPAATGSEARRAHLGLAAGYAARIVAGQRDLRNGTL